ncbi:Rpn family recombination-promoting nuclease/putative transposase [Nocardia carnea]|uniref:Rpn family recombination-promoting nuclease/putative transposase n=1 Tax=Nocardia carnea TaxID=37328 RepID=UPI002453F0A7|nr:Rpn family recombination-promoting nuclease/putative transposase [Nocardia carnea]
MRGFHTGNVATGRWQDPQTRAPATSPAIIPLVVQNTAEGRAWSAPTELSDRLDLDDAAREALGPYLPRFRFLLDDIAALDPAALRERDLTPAAGVLLVLQRIAPENPALGHDMRDWLDDLRALEIRPGSPRRLPDPAELPHHGQ